MTDTTFTGLGLAEPLIRALNQARFTQPTPIQAKAIGPILQGRDLLGLAQTGTGKTAAFALPLLHHLAADTAPLAKRSVRALILAPTRELALQIQAEIKMLSAHLKLRSVTVMGGVGRQPQVRAVARGADIMVGTPGRVLDLLQAGDMRLDTLTHFVLDEADRMLDFGFIRDIRKIVERLPEKRQSLLFSATMPDDVAKLAATILDRPERVEAGRDKMIAPERIDQQVHFVAQGDKRALLNQLLADGQVARAIVFTRTKHGANRVAKHLMTDGTEADAIHGNKSQSARQTALARFRDGRARVLVATDIAARGIDVAGISHVFNFDLPNVPESYVHRIGRTARAGASGTAVSFCDASEVEYLRDIEKLTGHRLQVIGGGAPDTVATKAPKKPRRNRNRGRRFQKAA
ncbi:MAG: DEAD/DEAH box helicase [Alphaproteobacteria bacterium]